MKLGILFFVSICLVFTSTFGVEVQKYDTLLFSQGKGVVDFFEWQGAPVTVWYYLPVGHTEASEIVFVMHGTKRNGEKYCDDWIPYAKKYNFLLIVPEFSKKHFPGDAGYNFGNMVDSVGNPLPKSIWAFSAIEPIFEFMKSRTGNSSSGYHIYGHSAGSQFVHRFTYFAPEASILSAICANAGWYTLPSFQQDFPYGLKGTDATEAQIKKALQKRLILYLGTKDNDPRHRYLRRTPEAMMQGKHRLARGQYFFKFASERSKEMNVEFTWQLRFAEGVAHKNAMMVEHAVLEIFGGKANAP